MEEISQEVRTGKARGLSTCVLTEETARIRFNELQDKEHALGSRRTKGRSLYQVVCAEDGHWIALFLYTGACWHLRPRDEWINWDPVLRSERLQLIVHQARFLILAEARDSRWASSVLAASVRDLPRQWEEVYGYRPLLAETFTDQETQAGTCYRAAGWEAVGFSRSDGKHYADEYPGEVRPKKLWLKPLEAQARAKLCAAELRPAQQAGDLPRTLAVDGKIIREHLGLIATLVDTEDGAPVAVAANPLGKGHELKTTQQLLASPQVSLLNATVTADSLHCQKLTAHIITREKGGDYILQVRDNQPELRRRGEQKLEGQAPPF